MEIKAAAKKTNNDLKDIVSAMPCAPRCYIRTFGCQQNVSDSERISGMMSEAGYRITDAAEDSDLIIFNTCAVREHAEDRVFGNVGEIKRLKEQNRKLIIALGGCMVQQPHIAKKLRESYPFVDIIFNTNELYVLPGHIAAVLEKNGPVVAIECGDYSIKEGLPISRGKQCQAFVPIMYGCDNFCTYCVVPLVRGRERSRKSEDVVTEFKKAVEDGYKDITLLGQNVNSYGKNLEEDINFAQLLRRLDALEGDFTIRFMTSHPKDATRELFDTIARCKKVSRHIHLPVQSGSDRILQQMNRGYTAQQYLGLIEYARQKIEGATFSSDILMGFPGETQQDAEATMALVEKVQYNSLFTFIYSKREGTPAANMPDDTLHKTKAERLNRLIAQQETISRGIREAMVGKTVNALVTERLPLGGYVALLDNNDDITLAGECRINEYVTCTITDFKKKRLYGEPV